MSSQKRDKDTGESAARGPAVEAARFTLEGEDLAVITVEVAPAAGLELLTGAESEVCRLVLSGCSNAEIAGARGTSIHTVEKQVGSIFRKLRVTSRSELAALWNGLP